MKLIFITTCFIGLMPTISYNMELGSGTPESSNFNQQKKIDDLQECSLADSPGTIHAQKVKKILEQIKEAEATNNSQNIESEISTFKDKTLKVKKNMDKKNCRLSCFLCPFTCGISMICYYCKK